MRGTCECKPSNSRGATRIAKTRHRDSNLGHGVLPDCETPFNCAQGLALRIERRQLEEVRLGERTRSGGHFFDCAVPVVRCNNAFAEVFSASANEKQRTFMPCDQRGVLLPRRAPYFAQHVADALRVFESGWGLGRQDDPTNDSQTVFAERTESGSGVVVQWT